MISIVVPVWRKDVYSKVAKPWIDRQVKEFGAQLIEVSGSSIFEAHESGRQQARHDLIMYVHDDVALIDPLNIAPAIVQAFKDHPSLGLIGPVGRGQVPTRVPWWQNPGDFYGHYLSRPNGELHYTSAGPVRLRAQRIKNPRLAPRKWRQWAKVALVDGFCLIESKSRMNVAWDAETFAGHWHGYDADRCLQARALGLDVMVSPWLFLHDNAGHAGYKGTDPQARDARDSRGRRIRSDGDALWLSHLDEVNALLAQKWRL